MLCKQLQQLDPFDPHTPLQLFQVTLLAFVPLHLLLCLSAVGVDVAGKWLLLGRRRQGVYPWDQVGLLVYRPCCFFYCHSSFTPVSRRIIPVPLLPAVAVLLGKPTLLSSISIGKALFGSCEICMST